ncbi:transcobalamin-1-like [Clarias gariepinus]|uniref:transcobalamin-1-like n=1 Tax=Clarias gariepinus TaxID=13013 RepID=UPI00234DEC17|nr:transcobalamin-1-like [Clarias gariepinus]
MAFKVAALLSTLTLIYLLSALLFTSGLSQSYPISLTVYNSLSKQNNLTFTTDIAYRGILIGAMKKIQAANKKFRFKTIEDPNYGPFLVSVNGLAGNNEEHTYWELLAERKGKIIVPDVGIGCFIPEPNDKVILKFTTW